MAAALSIGCVDDTSPPAEASPHHTVAAVPATVSVSPTDATQHVMVVYNDCPVPDPAIDASYTSRGITNNPLVSEIHAGLTSIDEAAGAGFDLSESKYAGRASDIEIVMYTDGYRFEPRLQSLFDQWSESLEIRAELRFIETFEEYQSMRDGACVPIRVLSVEPIYPDAYAVLRLFDGAFGSGGGTSSNGETLVDLLKQARSEPDPKVRRDLYAELEGYILKEALALPLYVDWRDTLVVTQPWVHGYNPRRFAGSSFHEVWFDETAPKRNLP